jgi:hypothetical protein
MILQASALVLMFVALYRFFGPVAAAGGVFIASTYLSAPLIAKVGNVKEQYMIACMVIGISSLMLYQSRRHWGWGLLAGAGLIWAPLFKETGTSALSAALLFTLAQPMLKHRTWRETGKDVLLLAGGGLGTLFPVFIWLAQAQAPMDYWPYGSILKLLWPGSDVNGFTYVSSSREWVPLSELVPRIMRYCGLLILPIALACGALVVGLVQLGARLSRKHLRDQTVVSHGLVLLLTVWWVLDMAFIWISRRSYEQYFLPLTASGAMLGAYFLGWYQLGLNKAVFKRRWMVAGVIGLMLMIAMIWPIFAGIKYSPHHGTEYNSRRRGYIQRLQEVHHMKQQGRLYPWEQVGDLIRRQSVPGDTIYVWGWYPGIYVRAQRLSSAPKAFEGNMHVLPPQQLADRLREILAAFEKEPPKFIVDSRKNHFPWTRPPLELWPCWVQPMLDLWPDQTPLPQDLRPRHRRGYVPAGVDPAHMNLFDRVYCLFLESHMRSMEENGRGLADPAEPERYRVMRPLRDYVMKNYIVVGDIGNHAVFRRK